MITFDIALWQRYDAMSGRLAGTPKGGHRKVMHKP